MKVSVIIVNFNNFKYLRQCIKSIKDCHVNLLYEIIVVDNNSEEGNIRDIIKDFEGVKIIQNKENLGFAKANNQGLRIAKGDYILYLNNDTIFIENTLEKVLDYFDNSLNKNMIIGCKLLNEDHSHQECIADFDSPANIFGEAFFLYKIFPNSKSLNKYHLNYKNIDTVVETDTVKGAFIFMKREDAIRMGGFDEDYFFYSEEVDMCYRFKESGGKVIYYPLTSLVHLGGGTTRNLHWFMFKNQTLSKRIFYKKHYSGLNYQLVVLFHYWGIIIRVPIYFLGGIFSFEPHLIKKSYYYCKQLFVQLPKR